MPIGSHTNPDKIVSSIKIKNNQIISTNKRNPTSIESNKRSLPTSPTIPKPQNNSKKKSKLFNNRFNVLADLDDNDGNNDVHEPLSLEPDDTTAHTPLKRILPPPIVVKRVENFIDVLTELSNLLGRNSFVCKLSSTHLKIQTEKPEDYRTLIHF